MFTEPKNVGDGAFPDTSQLHGAHIDPYPFGDGAAAHCSEGDGTESFKDGVAFDGDGTESFKDGVAFEGDGTESFIDALEGDGTESFKYGVAFEGDGTTESFKDGVAFEGEGTTESGHSINLEFEKVYNTEHILIHTFNLVLNSKNKLCYPYSEMLPMARPYRRPRKVFWISFGTNTTRSYPKHPRR